MPVEYSCIYLRRIQGQIVGTLPSLQAGWKIVFCFILFCHACLFIKLVCVCMCVCVCVCQNLARTSGLWSERLLALPCCKLLKATLIRGKNNSVILNHQSSLDQTLTERSTRLSSPIRGTRIAFPKHSASPKTKGLSGTAPIVP